MSARGKLDVLLVDDDARIRSSLRGVLEDEGHTVAEAADGRGAITALDGGSFDAVLLDVNMPGLSGLDVLVTIREMAPKTGVIMVSGEGSIATAVQALKRGAFDFVEKPVDPELLLRVLAQAAQLTELRRASGSEPGEALDILGQSPAITSLIADIRRVAPSQLKVLITGENGSGKDLVAEAIHRFSKRAGKPFVKLNCAAIPRDLVESELFGHEKGAFTGAMQRKVGRLERADKGTLFLDEIGDLSAESQAKLLRAIETGEVDRVGATDTIRVDVRIVSATNKDLAAAMESGEFRRDLYHRLNGVPLHVPPLRERTSDIPVLAQHFLERACAAEDKPGKRLTGEALAVLAEYRWPGNVRELRNLMERAAILVEGAEVRGEDLAPWLETGSATDEAPGLRGEIERREGEAIRRALEQAGWNVTQAAAGLGIDRTNLHRKMRKYGIARR
ncbi:MAG: sigma-54-dependent Fis family transcriptional regulator [Candidatus Eisenbacteria bacterium]|uniref:Sigma-54-dependent Fis family transcriptional regulator n=1 Tax=Eiseniibacteriota bacterium TaxID=2212470 RepID=A0A9D6L6J6_UNCEI|nr:sigma-54-dependent Fis family transcriptional regulator [Candidatus Eisenbacteria bacterium]MBI3539711.1 sigma-54-dependent Fis family transcriptional regulator [Candidatus Eisenbacteria bacterium]